MFNFLKRTAPWLALAGTLSLSATLPARLILGLRQLRIGYQRLGQHGAGEKPPAAGKRVSNTKFQWIEFPAGPQMLEALNISENARSRQHRRYSANLRAGCGRRLVYVGSEPANRSRSDSGAENSPIKTVAG